MICVYCEYQNKKTKNIDISERIQTNENYCDNV